MKDPRFLGKRASEVYALIRPELLARFESLKKDGLAERLWLFGSVATGTDTMASDIDLFVETRKIIFATVGRIESVLADWVMFPIHILVSDGKNYIPQEILKKRVAP